MDQVSSITPERSLVRVSKSPPKELPYCGLKLMMAGYSATPNQNLALANDGSLTVVYILHPILSIVFPIQADF